MTRNQQQLRDEFESLIVAEQRIPSDLPPWARDVQARTAARLLCRHGVTYARLQVMKCNGCGSYYGEDSHSFTMRQERFERYLEHRQELLEKRIREIVSTLGPGFGVILGGDPRGCTIKLTVPSGKTNDFGREGICVPTA